MDTEELQALAREIRPLILSLGKDVDRVIPHGSADSTTLGHISTVMAAGLMAQGIQLSPTVQLAMASLTVYGYVLGYRKAQNIPVFFVGEP